MNLKQAIEVLNREKYLGSELWTDAGHGSDAFALEMGTHAWLPAADAIAVAEKYEREKPIQPTGFYEIPPGAKRLDNLVSKKTSGAGMTKDLILKATVTPLLDEAVVTVPALITIGDKTHRTEVRKPLSELWAEVQASMAEKKGTENETEPT